MRENRSSLHNSRYEFTINRTETFLMITAEIRRSPRKTFLKRISMMNINIHTMIFVPVLKYWNPKRPRAFWKEGWLLRDNSTVVRPSCVLFNDNRRFNLNLFSICVYLHDIRDGKKLLFNIKLFFVVCADVKRCPYLVCVFSFFYLSDLYTRGANIGGKFIQHRLGIFDLHHLVGYPCNNGCSVSCMVDEWSESCMILELNLSR